MILGEKGSYYQVKYNGKIGYAYKVYIKKGTSYDINSLYGSLKIKTGLNVRTGPSTSYEKIGYLKSNEEVKVTGKVSNGWYEIKYNGETAYVSGLTKYVTFIKDFYVQPYECKIQTKMDINVRKGASTNYDSLGKLKKGVQIQTTGETTNGWYEIKYNGETAYITGLDKYVEVKNYPPVIYVENEYTITQNREFKVEDLKATAYDKEDKKVVEIKYDGTIDTKILGKQTITLTAKDSKGLVTTKFVTIKVVRDSQPIINCQYNNDDKPYILELGKSFKVEDLKATAEDYEDGNLAITYSGKVDATKLGDYTLTLTAKDSANQIVEKKVKVSVKEDKLPEINLTYNENAVKDVLVDKSTDTIKIEQGDSLTLSQFKSIIKATAHDGYNNDITSSIKIINFDKVDFNTDGIYKVDYQVTDNKKGCVKEITIDVVKNNGPKITVNPSKVSSSILYEENIQINVGGVNYSGPAFCVHQNSSFDLNMLGITASGWNEIYSNPTKDQIISYPVTTDNKVYTSKPGVYTLIVKSTDNKGFTSEKRFLIVVDEYTYNEAPVISLKDESPVKDGKLSIEYKSNIFEGCITKQEQADKLLEIVKATVSDDRDKDLAISADLDSQIDVKAIGAEYKLTLTAYDNGDQYNLDIKKGTIEITVVIE